jgi:hypothetical protein
VTLEYYDRATDSLKQVRGTLRRPFGNRAWAVARGGSILGGRIALGVGVGVGVGLAVGLPVERAVTEATGDRHIGFAAGWGANTATGLGVDALVFRMGWQRAAGQAFSRVSLWTAPAAIASHMIGVALDDLEAPVAAGDQQAVDLTLELTWGYGLGFFTYGAKSWWSNARRNLGL